MMWTALVSLISFNKRGQGGGFARAGGAGDQHQAGLLLGHLVENLGHLQVRPAWGCAVLSLRITIE